MSIDGAVDSAPTGGGMDEAPYKGNDSTRDAFTPVRPGLYYLPYFVCRQACAPSRLARVSQEGREEEENPECSRWQPVADNKC